MRKASRFLAGLVIASVAGCSTAAGGPGDLEPDSGSPPDIGGRNCSEPLSGAEPFGRMLRGEAEFSVPDYSVDGGSRIERSAVEFGVWFPRGRGADTPVLLTHPIIWPRPGLGVAKGQLEATLATQLKWSGTDGHQLSFDGRLLGPDDGLRGDVVKDFGEPRSDISQPGSALMTLCPSADVPAPKLAVSSTIGLVSPIWLAPTAPLSTLKVVVRAGDDTMSIEVAAVDGAVKVSPLQAFPPNRDLTLIISGSLDVLGRAFAVEPIRQLKTTAVLSDTTFVQPPPDGAIAATSPYGINEGKLMFQPKPGDFEVLIAVAEKPGAETFRMKLDWSEGCAQMSVAAVDEYGQITRVALDDRARAAQPTGPLPGSGGPIWLSVTGAAISCRPQSCPGLPICELSIAEVALE